MNQGLTRDLTAAREQCEHMAAEARSLREEVDLLKQAASDERRRLCGQVDNLRGSLSQVIREATETIAYVKAVLPNEEQAKQVDAFVEGFRIGSEGRVNHGDDHGLAQHLARPGR